MEEGGGGKRGRVPGEASVNVVGGRIMHGVVTRSGGVVDVELAKLGKVRG